MANMGIRIPQAGQAVDFEDLEMISSAVLRRQENFPNEPLAMTIGLVLANIGDRFAPVECINGEWKGFKVEIVATGDVPTCPNGHVMTQGEGLKLGWVA